MHKPSFKSVLSWMFIITGVCLVFAAGVLVGTNIMDESYAEEQSDKFIQAMSDDMAALVSTNQVYDVTPDYVLDPGRDMPVELMQGRELIGMLEIPSLELSLPIGSQWSAKAGSAMPCRLSGSAYSDDLIIAGHSYRAHFKGLYDIQAGDGVVFTDMDGNVFEYAVSGIEIIPGDRRDLLDSGDWDLTLFTCTANGAGRVTVRCDRVSDDYHVEGSEAHEMA